MISKAGASEPVGPPKFCFIRNERNSLSKVVLFWPTRLLKPIRFTSENIATHFFPCSMGGKTLIASII